MGENREKGCNRKFCADFECVTLGWLTKFSGLLEKLRGRE